MRSATCSVKEIKPLNFHLNSKSSPTSNSQQFTINRTRKEEVITFASTAQKCNDTHTALLQLTQSKQQSQKNGKPIKLGWNVSQVDLACIPGMSGGRYCRWFKALLLHALRTLLLILFSRKSNSLAMGFSFFFLSLIRYCFTQIHNHSAHWYQTSYLQSTFMRRCEIMKQHNASRLAFSHTPTKYMMLVLTLLLSTER